MTIFRCLLTWLAWSTLVGGGVGLARAVVMWWRQGAVEQRLPRLWIPAAADALRYGPALGLAVGLALAVPLLWLWSKRNVQPPHPLHSLLVVALAVAMVVASVPVQEFSGRMANRHTVRGRNVLLVVVDTLRRDHVGAYGYTRDTTPRIDALAREGVLFRDAYTVAPWTRPAVASLLTSLDPLRHTVDGDWAALPTRALTLAELLAGYGYDTRLYNAGNRNLDAEFQMTQGFQHVERARVSADRMVDRVLEDMADFRKHDFFVYVHLMDVHTPYFNHPEALYYAGAITLAQRFPPGSRFLSDHAVRQRNRSAPLGDELKTYIRDLYDAQVRFADRHVGRLVDGLRLWQLLERTLVVVVSDHGEELWDHGGFEHGHSLYQELLRIPLIIAGAGLPPATIDARVSLLDLAPTILGWLDLGLRLPDAQGSNLWPLGHSQIGDATIFATGILWGAEKQALITGQHKLIWNTTDLRGKHNVFVTPRVPYAQLFDLAADPNEVTDLADTASAKVRDLRRALQHHISAAALLKRQQTHPSDDLRHDLRALGYAQ